MLMIGGLSWFIYYMNRDVKEVEEDRLDTRKKILELLGLYVIVYNINVILSSI
jgi:hypothetical protein